MQRRHGIASRPWPFTGKVFCWTPSSEDQTSISRVSIHIVMRVFFKFSQSWEVNKDIACA